MAAAILVACGYTALVTLCAVKGAGKHITEVSTADAVIFNNVSAHSASLFTCS
jgi:hypothetical protein